MEKQQAILERDKLKSQLIGHLFNNREGWEIKDVIIGTREHAAAVYEKMYNENLSNEAALLFFAALDDDYDVFVISHQWPWGSGNLLYESIGSYRKHNAL